MIYSLPFSISLCLRGKNRIAILAAAKVLHGGGLLPYIRRKCASSAPRSLISAAIKCQLSGSTGASRQPFRRENVQIMQNLHFSLHVSQFVQ